MNADESSMPEEKEVIWFDSEKLQCPCGPGAVLGSSRPHRKCAKGSESRNT